MPVLSIFGCPIAFSVAAGITEGKTVKEISKRFNKGIQEIKDMERQINGMESKTKQLVVKMKSDNDKIVKIHKKLDDANLNADLALDIDFNKFFESFKDAVDTLYKLCQSYLSS